MFILVNKATCVVFPVGVLRRYISVLNKVMYDQVELSDSQHPNHCPCEVTMLSQIKCIMSSTYPFACPE